MFPRLRQMLVKEFIQMLRDPRMRGVVFVAPVVQMLVIAFALTTDVTDVRIGLLDEDGTVSSRALVAAFTGSGHFTAGMRLRGPGEIGPALDAARVRAVLRLPAGFEGALRAGRTAPVQFLADGADGNDAGVLFGYAAQIVGDFAERVRRERPGAGPPAVEMETRSWFNANLESRYYFVPGLIAVMLMVVSLLLASIAIVREKEIGTIEQVMVTPISGLEFILGKTIPYLLTGYLTMTLMFVAARLVFGVRVEGSWLLLYAMAGVYLAGNLGLALTISVISTTQQQALLTAFFFVLPGVLLSGFLFPLQNMPRGVQMLAWLNPMRWFLDILRAISQKGTGVAELWPALCAQVALAVCFVALAVLLFRKRAR